MTIQTAYFNMNFEARKQPRQIQLEVGIDIKGLLKGMMHALFIGPKLRRQNAPGSFQNITLNPQPLNY